MRVNNVGAVALSISPITASMVSKDTMKCNPSSPFVSRSKFPSYRFDPINGKNSASHKPINAQTFFGNKKEFPPDETKITAEFYMISKTRFAINIYPFFQPLIETVKTIPSKTYDLSSKIWNCHLNDYETLIGKITRDHSHVRVTPIPKVVIKTLRQYKDSEKKNFEKDLSSIDPKLLEILMPFQRDGICFGIERGGRCMIADDMGLGKTIQALGIVHYYKDDWPLLIVTPSSVRYQWSEAIFNFLPSVPTQYIHHFTSGKDFIDDAKIVIVSYDLLGRAINTFERGNFPTIILDESHVVKSAKTARTKAVQKIVAQSRHVILLSGTPALSRPMELYSQISLIWPHFMGFHEYAVRYCAAVKGNFGWDYSGSSNLQELRIFLEVRCLLRRLKSDVLKQLPSKIRQVIMLDPLLIESGTKEMKQAIKNYEKKSIKGTDRHNALLQYYSESSRARLPAVRDYISNLLTSNKKFLIFAHHQCVLDSISELAEEKKIKYIRIDGKTTSEQRKALVDIFQERSEYLVAILSITAANAGVTLTAAQLVIFAELFWNPGILCQAEDRAHRIGQDGSVIIRYLIAKNTVDDHLWPMIQRKMGILNAAGLNQNISFSDVDVVNHEDTNQTRLDAFVVKSPPKSSTNATTSSSSELNDSKELQWVDDLEEYLEDEHSTKIDVTAKNVNEPDKNVPSKNEFHHLLETDDMDDIDLASIDLDNITSYSTKP
ncbi:SWI/SNF-related matrix-associated actin-dependent regulator of chromatin subfamily A-like protein 1 isoform X2 [Cephus cinctus]|nr:SWI/SNF-related matrix-associated actin-dependent regulator of chromatin subfamily A-like protein 1 isoform X2 [Cephus cinctus]